MANSNKKYPPLKIALAVALCLILVFIGSRAYEFFAQEHQLDESLSDVQAKLAAAKSDEADLEAETQYLANPANLEKELRAQFNYKNPGETMIIIVPAASSTN